MMANVTQAIPDTTHNLLAGFHQGSGQAKKKKSTFPLPENPKVYMCVHTHTHTVQPLSCFPQYSPSSFCSAIQTMLLGAGEGGAGSQEHFTHYHFSSCNIQTVSWESY